MRKSVIFPIAALLIAAAVLAGCGTTAAPTAGVQESPLPTPTTQAAEPQTLRMALLPVLDVLPFHVAQQNGYFEQAGVNVELVPVKSAQERDTLLQTGQVDGQMTDLIGPIMFNQSGDKVRIVRVARKAYPEAPLFRMLARPGSAVKSPADLAGVPIGTAQNTVIAYLTDRMMAKAGLSPDEIKQEEVSAIPVRFELLINGELEAAVLPDPLASGALAAGAIPVIDDSSLADLSLSVLVFSTETVQNKPDAVRAFLEGWEMAVKELNANPETYHDLLIKEGRVPESIQGTFQMPPYPEAEVPTEAQIADVVAWAIEKGVIKTEVAYQPMVDASFLPK